MNLQDLLTTLYALAAVIALAYCALPFLILSIMKKMDTANKHLADIAFCAEELKKMNELVHFAQEIEANQRHGRNL